MMMRDAEEPVDVVAAKAAALVSQEVVCSPLPHPGSVGVHPGAQE